MDKPDGREHLGFPVMEERDGCYYVPPSDVYFLLCHIMWCVRPSKPNPNMTKSIGCSETDRMQMHGGHTG